MNDFLYINHANDFALDVGAEVFHPMVSVVHFDELGEIRHSLNKMGVYAIFVQDYIVLVCDYCLMFYQRQFQAQAEKQGDLLSRFQRVLTDYYEEAHGHTALEIRC